MCAFIGAYIGGALKKKHYSPIRINRVMHDTLQTILSPDGIHANLLVVRQIKPSDD